MGKIGSTVSNMTYQAIDSGRLPSRISGGAVDLYNSGTGYVKMTFGTPISEPLHLMGANEKFQKTDINLLSGQFRVLGVGADVSLTKIRDNGVELTFDVSLFAGLELTAKFPDCDLPLRISSKSN